MSPLLLISHHLFVAAVGSQGGARIKPTRQEVFPENSGRGCQSRFTSARDASAIPLEVLGDTRSMPLAGTRSLRASALASE